MYQAINIVKPGLQIGDIGAVIQKHAYDNNFSVVKDYCGHGIGKNFHESPQILHYGIKNTGMRLEEGMTFTIEPMINSGQYKTKLLSDGWPVVTQDHSLSAQWEHTILVTNNGYEILTLRDEENIEKKL
jgi:methionyl aminopeptidase